MTEWTNWLELLFNSSMVCILGTERSFDDALVCMCGGRVTCSRGLVQNSCSLVVLWPGPQAFRQVVFTLTRVDHGAQWGI